MKAIYRRLRSLLRLAVLIRSDSSGPVQTVQVAVGSETLTDVEHLEPYGFTSRAKAGAAVLLAALKGNPGHSVAVSIGGRQFRLRDLEKGEVALYDDLGNVIHLMRDKLRVNAVTLLEATAPTTNISGDVNIIGNTTFTGTVTANGKDIGDTSRHSGVTPGSGTSGEVV